MSSHLEVDEGIESDACVEQLLRPALCGWKKREHDNSGCDQMKPAEQSETDPRRSIIMRKNSHLQLQATVRNSPPSPTSNGARSPMPRRPLRDLTSGMPAVRPPACIPGDSFWLDVRSGRDLSTMTNEDEEEEEMSGMPMDLASSPSERKMSKKESKRSKNWRRRQRRKQRWKQSQQQGYTDSVSSSNSSTDEDEEEVATEAYVCSVCLDVYFNPYMCQPCKHIFCEPCLRTLAQNWPDNTPCPLCRTIITHVFFQKDLNQRAKTFLPKEFLRRKQYFQKASCAKWPLPSCRKLFRIFGGFRRPTISGTRRQMLRTGGGFRLNAPDFDEDAHGWHLDMDMVTIYIYSGNWIIGFFVFCILYYLFFTLFLTA
ncbi:uncharacterized protein LOC144215837 isoform X2 [Stigmatopora nigra]